MSIEYEDDKPQWFSISTHLKQEDRAYYNLLASRVECFNPRIQEVSAQPVHRFCVERHTQLSERVQLLLAAINYQGRLMIERQLVGQTA